MKTEVTLDQDDIRDMHDVVYEVYDEKPSDDFIKFCWDQLPDHIKGTAIKWGCGDTVFRDNMCEWLSEYKAVVIKKYKEVIDE